MEKTDNGTLIPAEQDRALCFVLLLIICHMSVPVCIPVVAAPVPEPVLLPVANGPPPTTVPSHLCVSTGPSEPVSPVVIHPIGLHMAGDSFAITGSTSLPADHAIMVNVLCGHSLTLKAPVSDCNGISGEAMITSDPSGGTGSWVYEVNTSGFQPDHYIVTVSTETDGSFAEIQGDFFLLSPDKSTAPDRLPVRIDPIPSFTTHEAVTISGTTTDPPGEYLVLTIAPGVFLPGGTWEPHATATGRQITGRAEVLPGKNGRNVWIFRLDSGDLEQGDYLVEAFSAAGDRTGYGIFTVRWDPGVPCALQPAPASIPATSHPAPVPALLILMSGGVYCICRKYIRK